MTGGYTRRRVFVYIFIEDKTSAGHYKTCIHIEMGKNIKHSGKKHTHIKHYKI